MYDEEDREGRTRENSFIICPINMSPVDTSLVVPNLGLKTAIDKFLDENPWAFEFNPKEKCADI